MQFRDKRLTVVVGNYGSGKTELSISVARHLKAVEKQKTALIDLDIVNPYFRSGEKRELLESEGIRVLMPTFAMTSVDIPALPAQIQSVFDEKNEHVVFDVGGDDTGATALGRYAHFFEKEKENLRCLFVINAMRPLTRTCDDVLDLMHRISLRSRMQFTGLVNNTNLQGETDADVLLQGQQLTLDVSKQSGIPLVMITGQRSVLDKMPPEYGPLYFPLERVMIPEWMD